MPAMYHLARALVVAVAVLVVDAPRAFAATTVLTVEAESMAASSGRVRSDSQASGGRAVLLATNGSLSAVTVGCSSCRGRPAGAAGAAAGRA